MQLLGSRKCSLWHGDGTPEPRSQLASILALNARTFLALEVFLKGWPLASKMAQCVPVSESDSLSLVPGRTQ